MLYLFAFISASKTDNDIEYYHGSWETQEYTPMQLIIRRITRSRFELMLNYTKLNYTDGYSVHGEANFRRAKRYDLSRHVEIIGFSDSHKKNIFVIVPNKRYNLTLFRYNKEFDNLLKSDNITHRKLNSYVSKMHIGREIQSFHMKKEFHENTRDFWYTLNYSLKGTYHSVLNRLTFHGDKIDLINLVIEGKVFAVFCGVIFCFQRIIWKFTNFNYTEPFSYFSTILNCYFDLMFGYFLLNTGNSWIQLNLIYKLLFCMTIFLNFIPETKVFIKVIKRDIRNRSRTRYLYRVITSLIFFLIYLWMFSILPFQTIFALLVLFSMWLPQIITSAFAGIKKSTPTFYVLFVTLCRLSPFVYMNIIEYNIFGFNHQKKFYLVCFWCLIQIIIFGLQNKFGGDFFLPERFRRKPYDYYDKIIPQNTKCMICLDDINSNDIYIATPCNHFFHENCFSEWYNSHQICPTCRKELPPFPTLK